VQPTTRINELFRN